MQNFREKFTARKITGILMYAIILALVGLLQSVALGWDFSTYTSFDFYFRICYRVILIILAFTSTINVLFDKTWRSEKVQSARNKYLKLVKVKDISFEEFLVGYNRGLKISAWKNKIRKRIARIEKFLENRKPSKKKLEKLEYYRTLLTDEYIEAHYDYLNVRCSKVYSSDFTAEDSFSDGGIIKTRSNFGTAVTKFSLKKLAPYILVTLLTGSIIYNIAVETGISFWINIVTDLALVVLRVADAAYNTPVLVDIEYTNVYLNKASILEKYIEWCEKTSREESKAHKVIAYIESTEAPGEA